MKADFSSTIHRYGMFDVVCWPETCLNLFLLICGWTSSLLFVIQHGNPQRKVNGGPIIWPFAQRSNNVNYTFRLRFGSKYCGWTLNVCDMVVISMQCLGRNCCGWALQLHPLRPHHPRALRLCLHGGQWGHLRYMPKEPRCWPSNLHQPKQIDQPDRLIDHGFPQVRWCPECWSERVPD